MTTYTGDDLGTAGCRLGHCLFLNRYRLWNGRWYGWIVGAVGRHRSGMPWRLVPVVPLRMITVTPKLAKEAEHMLQSSLCRSRREDQRNEQDDGG